ncbi:Piso0_002315 [Millerozyma farinosa CBS 7064]|uniref:Piso0_002315 protein n=1 Tax=Pichia sorbitophila (strain ATCC MYA-4447 / BCRC 22081 / CBS 7064 / NBRC 10061 / NRRL Y-12695) TaxID=559304 RepID=G8YEQ3_PICSO|nr:Piso0_002315 [Millerozyma farinosa CBS 7064]
MGMEDIISKVTTLIRTMVFRERDFDRATLGIRDSPLFGKLIRWRFTDAILIGLLLVTTVWAENLKPFERQFYVNDVTISHPFAEHERVPVTDLMMYAFWMPLGVIVTVAVVVTTSRNKIYVTYVSAMGLFISTLMAGIVTDILKNFIGRHRPDFLARCVPREDAPLNTMVFAQDVCTTDNIPRLLDGFRTTPSGHSSISFAGLTYLSLWLAGQSVAANEYSGAWRTILSFAPTLGAALIALSRTEDYRHHFVDILIGSCLGLAISFWSYFRLFPALSHKESYNPLVILSESYDSDKSAHDYDYVPTSEPNDV